MYKTLNKNQDPPPEPKFQSEKQKKRITKN